MGHKGAPDMDIGWVAPLSGTERQKAWAEDIRAATMPRLLEQLGLEQPNSPVQLPGLQFELSAVFAQELRTWFRDQSSSAWWIEVGQKSNPHLIVSAIRHMTRAIEHEHLDFIRDPEAIARFERGGI